MSTWSSSKQFLPRFCKLTYLSLIAFQVGENQQKPERRRKKKVKKIKSRKSFLEKIYSRIKEFARRMLVQIFFFILTLRIFTKEINESWPKKF